MAQGEQIFQGKREGEMTKQEEIRRGIISAIKSCWKVDKMQIHDNYDLDEEEAASKVLSYLHSQGCALKVDGELPKEVMYGQEAYTQEDIERFLFQAGYVATVPLIEVKE